MICHKERETIQLHLCQMDSIHTAQNGITVASSFLGPLSSVATNLLQKFYNSGDGSTDEYTMKGRSIKSIVPKHLLFTESYSLIEWIYFLECFNILRYPLFILWTLCNVLLWAWYYSKWRFYCSVILDVYIRQACKWRYSKKFLKFND